jgi:hypothetical protein
MVSLHTKETDYIIGADRGREAKEQYSLWPPQRIVQLLGTAAQPDSIGKRHGQQGIQELPAQSILGQGDCSLFDQLDSTHQSASLSR